MNYLYERKYLDESDVIILKTDTECNLIVLTDSEYNNYKNGRDFKHFGTGVKKSPTRIGVPYSGYWNIVVDSGGGSSTIKCSLSYITAR